MGTVIGTLQYDTPCTISQHSEIINYLKESAEKEHLNPFSLYEDFTITPGKDTFSVDLNGLTLWWVGKETAIKRINDYLLKMKNHLLEQGLQNVEITKAIVI